MDLLDWARGPLLLAAAAVFVLGVAWRWIAPRRLPLSSTGGAARVPFGRASALRAALVFLGHAPHTAFIRRHTGLHGPALAAGRLSANVGNLTAIGRSTQAPPGRTATGSWPDLESAAATPRRRHVHGAH